MDSPLYKSRNKWISIKSVGFIEGLIGSGLLILYNSAPTLSVKEDKWNKYVVSGSTSYLNSPLVLLEMSKDLANIIVNKCTFYDRAIESIGAIPNQIQFDPGNLNDRKALNLEKNLP